MSSTSLNLKNLKRHLDHDTAEMVLELINRGIIDRPRVADGEKYLYIDTRILKAPYGVISQQEVKHACSKNLSGAAWGVYCYIVTCCSGRISLDGTEIGGKQIMLATGYSKATIYRACDQLIEAGLIKASNKTANRRAWLLCNPYSDEIQDKASELALMSAAREQDIKSQISEHNKQIRSVNNPVNKPVNSRNSETQKSNIVIKSAPNINYDQFNSNLLIGGNQNQHSQAGQWNEETEFDLLVGYLDRHFEEQISSLKLANDADKQHRYTELAKRRVEAISEDDTAAVKLIDHTYQRLSHQEERMVLRIWSDEPFKIADDLLTRRTNKTCILRYWGWNGTQSLKKIAKYIHRYATTKLETYQT